MFDKLVAATLFVSFIAMSTSGLLIFVTERPSFTIQMHPVHKLFGLVMVAAMIAHIALNFRALRVYIRSRAVAITGGVCWWRCWWCFMRWRSTTGCRRRLPSR